jgi:hypothetical protein
MPNRITQHVEILLPVGVPPTVDSGAVGLVFAIGAGEPRTYTITPTSLGTVTGTASGSTKTITVGTAVPVGDLVTVHAALRGAVITSVTDARGNTYTADGGIIGSTATPPSASSASSKLTTALQVGDLITINFDVATIRYAIQAFAWSGVYWVGIDKTASGFDTTIGLNPTTLGNVLPANTTTKGLIITTVCTSPGASLPTQPSGNPNVLLVSALNSLGTTPAILGVTYIIADVSGSYKPGVQFTGNNTPWATFAQTLALISPIVDATTARLVFTISGTDVPSFTEDTNTEYLDFVPSATEVATHVYSDANTISLKLNPSAPISDVATIGLILTPSAIEEPPPVFYTDVGTIALLFDFGADDCHSILTPHWDVFISQRWRITSIHQRWHITAVQNRWAMWVIGVAIDNPCPEPEFVSEVFAGDAA